MGAPEIQVRNGIEDGRYVGLSGRYWLELRVDAHGSERVSGELQSTGPTGFYASFSTTAKPDTEAAIEWTDAGGATASGMLRLEPLADPPGTVTVTLELHEGLSPLPAGAVATIEAHRTRGGLRELGLEVEVEDGVLAANGTEYTNLRDDLHGCLERAGFTVREVGEPSTIPARAGGWATSDIFASLDAAMRSTAQSDLDVPAWEVHLLLVSQTRRDGLLGLMFDPVGGLPRQGAAVFVDSVRNDSSGAPFADRLVQTAVHEIGHALNLTHRFGRDVRRSSSSSFMNYDWRFRGGDVQGYWEAFERRFDDDELAHLRHAARSKVIPGGSPFGSGDYWEPNFAGSTEGSSESPWRDLRLWLTPPPAGTAFAYGQPVFLEVSLLNLGAQPVSVPRHALDVKAGQLDVLLRRMDATAGATGLSESSAFVPVMRRCFDVGAAGEVALGRGESMHANLNLAYGAANSDVADPGAYEVLPVLSFPTAEDGLDQVVVGCPLTIEVLPPRNRAEEQEGEILYRPDVRMSLALGGSTALQAAADDLEELRARRADRAGRAPVGAADPVAAVLARAAGIDAGRRGDASRAAGLLTEALAPGARDSFDPHTAEHTRRLAEQYAAELAPQASLGTPVVVDLWTTGPDGSRAGGRGVGFLIDHGSPPEPGAPAAAESDQGVWAGRGWGVLAPADQLPTDAMDRDAGLGAEVTVSPGDGLSQRVTVSRIDLIGQQQDDGDRDQPALALLRLANGVPLVSSLVDLPEREGEDVSDFFGRSGPAAAIAGLRAEDVAAWTAAADKALAEPPARSAETTDALVSFRYSGLRLGDGSRLDDLASWRCWLTPRCQPPRPRDVSEGPYFRSPYDPGTGVGEAPKKAT